MLAWNAVEAGKILETYKLYENKPPDMIMPKTGTKVECRNAPDTGTLIVPDIRLFRKPYTGYPGFFITYTVR